MAINYDPVGDNPYDAQEFRPDQLPALAQGRGQMAEANQWLSQPGAQAADAVAGDRFAQVNQEAYRRAAMGGPMAAQASARDVAAAYGGGARAGGMHAAQEYGQRADMALGNYQNLYDSDVAQYRTAAEAYNDKQRINREIQQANRDRESNFAKNAISSIPILGSI